MEMNIENELKPTLSNEGETRKVVWWKRLLFDEDYTSVSKHMKHVGYMGFVLLLTLSYITCQQHYEKTARAINKQLRDIRDIEYEYKYLLQEWTIKTKESELEKRMSTLGIESSSTPPYSININD